jgi:hypothetical protein
MGCTSCYVCYYTYYIAFIMYVISCYVFELTVPGATFILSSLLASRLCRVQCIQYMHIQYMFMGMCVCTV